MVNRWLFASPAQFVSQKPLKTTSLPPRHNFKVQNALQIPNDVFHGHQMRWTNL
jgi:hypothetical protein